MYCPKVLVIPRNRWLRLNMAEKLFTGTLNHNQNKKNNNFSVMLNSVYGKLMRSCCDGLSVVLTTLFLDRLTLSAFKSSTQFTSFHQYSDMLTNQQFGEKGHGKLFMNNSVKEHSPDPRI